MKWLAIVLMMALLIAPALALTDTENRYDQEFNKLKDTLDYVYRDGDLVAWQIINYNPEYEYVIRIYSYQHREILEEYPIIPDQLFLNGETISGTVPFTYIYPSMSRIHINLQRWISGIEYGNKIDQKKISKYCQRNRYVSSYGDMACDIGKNLDIVTITAFTKTVDTNSYDNLVRYFTRASTDRIAGASFEAMKKVDDFQ